MLTILETCCARFQIIDERYDGNRQEGIRIAFSSTDIDHKPHRTILDMEKIH